MTRNDYIDARECLAKLSFSLAFDACVDSSDLKELVRIMSRLCDEFAAEQRAIHRRQQAAKAAARRRRENYM